MGEIYVERDVTIQLSNGKIITIPYGFKWDLSSVPKILEYISTRW